MPAYPSSFTQGGTAAPGATNSSTGALSPVAGVGYMAVITQIGTVSNPVTSVTGWGQTWQEIAGMGLQWSTGGTLRRTQVFYCYAVAPTAGALTFNYSAPGDILDWTILQINECTPNVVLAGTEQRSVANATMTANSLTESITVAALSSPFNRWLSIGVSNNDDSGNRLERRADPGGDFDWTTVSVRNVTNGGRARTVVTGYSTATGPDRTPGLFCVTAGSYFQCAVELEGIREISPISPPYGPEVKGSMARNFGRRVRTIDRTKVGQLSGGKTYMYSLFVTPRQREPLWIPGTWGGS